MTFLKPASRITLPRAAPVLASAMACSCLVSMGAHAARPPAGPSYVGVWQGTIGTAPVRACLRETDSQYFYVKHGQPIALVPDMDPATRSVRQVPSHPMWRELPRNADAALPAPTWRLEQVTRDTLGGTWSDPRKPGAKPLPVRLARVPTPSDGLSMECPEAYYEPLHQAAVVQSKPAMVEGRPYRQLLTATGTAFELPAGDPAAQALNAWSQAWLREQRVSAIECRLNGGEPWQAEVVPVSWNGAVLVVHDQLPDTFCGGAHSDWRSAFLSFDARSGAPLDPWTWLPEARFRHLALAEAEQDDRVDCRPSAAGDGVSFDPPHPTPDGLAFIARYPHVLRACEADLVLPWPAVRADLTPAGQAIARAFGVK